MVTVFLGSGEFSRDLLFDLLRNGFEINAVITRPDHPAGRGLRSRATAVKTLAKSEGMMIFQPSGPTDPAFKAALDWSRPDLLLVADYGYLLPRDILEYPTAGCVNVHPSLLPRYRGAAPIQKALMRGESETGVTLMILDEGMDSGDIIAMERIAIEDSDDALTLRGKLASMGARMVADMIPSFARGGIVPFPQDEELATYADPISKADTIIDWTREAADINNQVRALRPRPGAYTKLGGKRIKILRSLIRYDIAAVPGEILLPERDFLLVGTGRGALQVEELQMEGKKPLNAAEFLRGYRLRKNEHFGEGQTR